MIQFFKLFHAREKVLKKKKECLLLCFNTEINFIGKKLPFRKLKKTKPEQKWKREQELALDEMEKKRILFLLFLIFTVSKTIIHWSWFFIFVTVFFFFFERVPF